MAQTDKFRKSKSLFSTTLSSGISTGTGDTITLASVSGLPTDTEITITIDRVDSNGNATPSKLERITGTISGSNLINYTRGIDGTTEQQHSSGAVIELIWNADDLNDMIDGILVQHDQNGYHKSLTDTSGNEWISQSATGSAVNEFTIANAATGTGPELQATGDDTNIDIEMHPKGSGVVKQPTSVQFYVVEGASSVSTGDGKFYFKAPAQIDGMNLTGVHAEVITAGTTGTTDIQIHNVTGAVDMLTTKLTIDSAETGSDTAATAAVIDTANDDVSEHDVIRVDVDAVSTTAPQGLIVTLEFDLP